MNKWAWSSHVSHWVWVNDRKKVKLGEITWHCTSTLAGTWHVLQEYVLYVGSQIASLALSLPLLFLTPCHLNGRSWSLVERFVCEPSLRSIQIKVQILNCPYLSLGEEKLWDVPCEAWAKPDYSSAHILDVRSKLKLKNLSNALVIFKPFYESVLDVWYDELWPGSSVG